MKGENATKKMDWKMLQAWNILIHDSAGSKRINTKQPAIQAKQQKTERPGQCSARSDNDLDSKPQKQWWKWSNHESKCLPLLVAPGWEGSDAGYAVRLGEQGEAYGFLRAKVHRCGSMLR